MEDASARIEQLVRARSDALRDRRPVTEIEKALEDAWAEFRRQRAVKANGSTVDISRRARVERELEMIMTAADPLE